MADISSPTSRAAYLLALMSLKGVGPWTAVKAMREFPDPVSLLRASPAEREAALHRRFAGRLSELSEADWPALLEVGEAHIAAHERRDVRVISIDDEDYPPLMRLAPSPAAVLYLRGEVGVLRHPETVAVVGTRKPTVAGSEVAYRLAHALATAGFSIVSGLAAGIDSAAHEGALAAEGRTVAILGTAIDKVYPAANKRLAERIAGNGGALMSEYPFDFPTSGRHFVERDRLQAAMSIAVIAVQTGTEGGTLHTVKFAEEANRAVLVPRPLASESEHAMYGGIHVLIDSGRATVIESQDEYADLAAFLRDSGRWLTDGRSGPRPTFGSSEGPTLSGGDSVGLSDQTTLGL